MRQIHKITGRVEADFHYHGFSVGTSLGRLSGGMPLVGLELSGEGSDGTVALSLTEDNARALHVALGAKLEQLEDR